MNNDDYEYLKRILYKKKGNYIIKKEQKPLTLKQKSYKIMSNVKTFCSIENSSIERGVKRWNLRV